MRIAHILPGSAIFPLKKHNGRYEWALRLAKLQSRAGHDVTIFSGTASSEGEENLRWQTVARMTNKSETNRALFELAFSQEFDLYHSHFDVLGAEVADQTDKPVVTTQHWFPNEKTAKANDVNAKRNHYFVPVTDYMKSVDESMGLHISERIYHGIDLSLFTPSDTTNNRYICAGRIAPGKGTREAVQLAVETGINLDIVGKLNAEDEAYWKSFSDLVDDVQIRYIGPVSQQDLARYFAAAKAFIFPSKQIEAFGQTTIEAQACGCPVIISTVGASSELVLHGKTGFIADSRDDFVQAIANIDSVMRRDCREFAEKFNINQMVKAYDDLYQKLMIR